LTSGVSGFGWSVTRPSTPANIDTDTPSKAISKLKALLEGTEFYQKVTPTLAHLREVYEYSKRFGVTSKIYICPLSSINEAFFRGGILFACLYDKKVRDVFAAGGRYDSLIKEHRPKIGNRFEERHAVGFSLNWEKQLAKQVPKATGKAFLKKAAEEEAQGIFSAKRVGFFCSCSKAPTPLLTMVPVRCTRR